MKKDFLIGERVNQAQTLSCVTQLKIWDMCLLASKSETLRGYTIENPWCYFHMLVYGTCDPFFR